MFSPFTVKSATWNGVKSRKIKNIWPNTLAAGGVSWLTRALGYVGCFDGLQLREAAKKKFLH